MSDAQYGFLLRHRLILPTVTTSIRDPVRETGIVEVIQISTTTSMIRSYSNTHICTTHSIPSPRKLSDPSSQPMNSCLHSQPVTSARRPQKSEKFFPDKNPSLSGFLCDSRINQSLACQPIKYHPHSLFGHQVHKGDPPSSTIRSSVSGPLGPEGGPLMPNIASLSVLAHLTLLPHSNL